MTASAALPQPATSRAVVIGIPEVRSNRAALDWAAAEASARHQPLHVLCAVQWGQQVAPWHPAPDPSAATQLSRLAQGAVASAIAHVRATWPELSVDGEAVNGAPGATLVELSGGAALTVVGTRQLGAIGGVVLGSVSSEVAAHATGTVIVVGGPGPLPEDDAAVVVGLDPYARDDSTLAYAFEHAARHGRRLEAVICQNPDAANADTAPGRARRWLAEVVTGWQHKNPEVPVHTAVLRAHPVTGLVSAARDQDLLVIGAGTRHHRLGSLLGSVTQGVLHHAGCPVAVVHSTAI